MNIELKIGTKLNVDGVDCEVVESNKCSDCEIQKSTSHIKYADGRSMKCGTKENGNTSYFVCRKDDRTDKKNISFRKISK